MALKDLLSWEELEVLDDMMDDWNDKDRHGELARGWGYDEDKLDAVSTLYTKVKEARGY